MSQIDQIQDIVILTIKTIKALPEDHPFRLKIEEQYAKIHLKFFVDVLCQIAIIEALQECASSANNADSSSTKETVAKSAEDGGATSASPDA